MVNYIGQQFGNYRLISLLGEGAFAKVYLGEHIHLETQAAIKILHTQIGENDQGQFLKEARTIARLDHPNIVRVLDFGIDSSSPYLVIAYAPGGTLRARHPKGEQLSLATILPYIEQVADALDYIHGQKLMHRDVKPENLLLGTSGNVLLGDFGIVAVAHKTVSLTDLGFAGTAPYMAPEQIQHQPRPASDQYALAVVIYEWLTGRRPFQGGGWVIYQRHLYTPPPALHDFVPTLPPLVEVVVLKALSKDPKQRFANVKAFATALKHASSMVQTPPALMSDTATTLSNSVQLTTPVIPQWNPPQQSMQQATPFNPPALLAHGNGLIGMPSPPHTDQPLNASVPSSLPSTLMPSSNSSLVSPPIHQQALSFVANPSPGNIQSTRRSVWRAIVAGGVFLIGLILSFVYSGGSFNLVFIFIFVITLYFTLLTSLILFLPKRKVLFPVMVLIGLFMIFLTGHSFSGLIISTAGTTLIILFMLALRKVIFRV